MTRTDLAAAIYNTAHITGDFLLRSGTRSTEYFDKYLFEAKPALLKAIAEHLAPLVPAGTDVLCGLELGGVPLATALSIHTGIPAAFVRKKAKEYGTCKIAEGSDINGKNILVVEDVITSGGQVVLSAADLRAHGANIVGAVCVIDRESGGADALKTIGINLTPLFTMTELKSVGATL